MKKLTVLSVLLLAVSAATTALAQTEYYPEDNSVTNKEQGRYQTVLVTAEDGTIVYVDQASSKLDGAKKFLLKDNLNNGLYTIKFGGSGVTATTAKFAVGVGITGYDTTLEVKGEPVADANGKYSHGFVTPAGGVDFSNGGIILVKIGDDVMAYPANNGLTLSGQTQAMFGVQIDDVPGNTSVEVYFRPGASVQ